MNTWTVYLGKWHSIFHMLHKDCQIFRRKETWEESIRSQLFASESPHEMLRADDSEAKERDPACIRLKDIPPPHTGPMQLKVYAKPVSFYPMDLNDVFYQFCARCKVEYVRSLS